MIAHCTATLLTAVLMGAICTAGAGAEVVGYWPMDAGEGMLAHDRAAAGNDAVIFGPQWAKGHDGGGLRFGGAGADDYLVIAGEPGLALEDGFTLQLWWLKESGGVQILFRKGGHDRYTCYAYLEGALHFSVVDIEGESHAVEAPAPHDGWHHLAFTCGEKQMAIVIDGEITATGQVPGTRLLSTPAPLLIGTYSPGYRYCLGGVIDDLCISDGPLPPAELSAELDRARDLAPPQVSARHFEPDRGTLVLAKDGAPGATIVIAEDASPLQLQPALELRRCLRRMTGARLPMTTAAQAPDGDLILVGASRLTDDLDLAEDLAGDEFVIRAEPGRLILLGHDALLGGDAGSAFNPGRCKCGTSNAVHAFLHDHCGARWLMPGRLGEVLPEHSTLEVPAMHRREQPWRTYSLGSLSRERDWAACHLIGSRVFIRHRGGHLWYSLVPEEQHFAEHPEWFALIDGRRRGQGNHLCTTNPELFNLALHELRAIFDAGYEWVELGQTDGYQRCRCPECEALDVYRETVGYWVPGVPADRVHLFHHALARAIAESHPGRTVLIISYGPTGEVPDAIESFGENVAIEFTHSPQALIDRWTDYHDRFTAYVYWFGLYQRMGFGPKSSPQHVADEVQRMRRAGVEAFYLCGGGECWATEAPGYYVYSRLQRDPELQADGLVDEFCQALFGPAAEAMREYFDTLYRAAERYRQVTRHEPEMGEPFRGRRLETSEVYGECFPPAMMAECAALLDRAEAQADDEDERRRIAYFRDGFHFIRLTAECFRSLQRWRENPGPRTRDAHRELLAQREQFVHAMLQRDAARGGDLPPVFKASREVLLHGPRNRYEELSEPLQ